MQAATNNNSIKQGGQVITTVTTTKGNDKQTATTAQPFTFGISGDADLVATIANTN